MEYFCTIVGAREQCIVQLVDSWYDIMVRNATLIFQLLALALSHNNLEIAQSLK